MQMMDYGSMMSGIYNSPDIRYSVWHMSQEDLNDLIAYLKTLK